MKSTFLFFAALPLLCAGCGGAGAEGSAGAEKETPPAPVKFTLSYNLNGGSGDFAPVTVDSGAVANAPSATPSKPDGCFTGWFADSAATAPFNFDAPVVASATVYAGWEKRHTVTLRNVGDAPQRLYVCDGDAVPLPMPEKPDVSFVDWYADSAYTVKFGGVGQLRGDTALYARWINALRVEVSERSFHCPLLEKTFTFFVAYEDEQGTYTNRMACKTRELYSRHDDSIYNGSSYSGGEADSVCRSKGDGWYLPSGCEFGNFSFAKSETLPFQPFSIGSAYWTSSNTECSWDKASFTYCELSTYGDSWAIGRSDQNKRYKVRCAWRPE
jgi:uncharacterized repeat protein (TIGR02543 family)